MVLCADTLESELGGDKWAKYDFAAMALERIACCVVSRICRRDLNRYKNIVGIDLDIFFPEMLPPCSLVIPLDCIKQ